jgi:hypothetical protein
MYMLREQMLTVGHHRREYHQTGESAAAGSTSRLSQAGTPHTMCSKPSHLTIPSY